MDESFLTNRFLPMAQSIYFDELLASSNNPPSESSYIITEDNNFLITENGDYLITEG
jgi:hypothetical protein